MYRIKHEVINSTQPEKVSIEPDSNRNKKVEMFKDISYNNLQNEKGKRTTNISLVESISSNSNTAQKSRKTDSKNKSSIQVSTKQSPYKKVKAIQSKNKKKLCDYQQEKRAQVPSSNLVIMMNEKQSMHDTSASKNLKTDSQPPPSSKKTVSNEYKRVKKEINSEKLVIEVKQNTFTIDSDTKINSGKISDMNENANDGKDQKLKALQNMPIKKFIVYNKEETKYKQSGFEEEKKLILSDEKQIKTVVHDKVENKTTTKVASEFYRIGKILGKGAFGKVNLAIHKESGELVAIKSINKSYLSDSASKHKVMQEVTILKMIKHKNIICLNETFETDTHIIFVMEL